MATKEERQQIYDEEEVFADFGSVAETEKTKRREEYNMFRDAARSVPKTILKGVIGSVTELDGGTLVAYIDQIRRLGRNEEGNTAEGYFQTIIPVSQMIAYDPKQYAGEEGKMNSGRNSRDVLVQKFIFAFTMYVKKKELLLVQD